MTRSSRSSGCAPPPGQTTPASRTAPLARHRAADSLMAFASVYPLVTARAVARPFTYEVPDDVTVGAIVRDAVRPLAGAWDRRLARRERARRRQGQAGRRGDRPGAGGAGRAGALARRLLRLDAGPRARAGGARDAEAPQGAGAAGRAAGARRRRGAARALAAADRRGRRGSWPPSTGAAGTSCCTARPGAGRPRCISRRAPPCSSGASARSSSCRRSRWRPRRSAVSARGSAISVAILHSALTEAERRDERARIVERRGADRRRGALRRVRARAGSRPDRRRRGARLLVQAGLRPPLRRPHGRRQARDPRGRRRGLRVGDAAARELGGARAPVARRPDRRRAAAGARRSTCGARPAIRCRRRCSPSCAAVAERRGKAILLLNRRGIAPALHCRACGTTIRCPNCDVALVLHSDSELRCHHCGFAQAAPTACPVCESPDLARLGAGTQKLERELARELPDLELIRLDGDAVVQARGAGRAAAAVRRDAGVGAARDADGGEGAPLLGRRAGRRDRRRHRTRPARLPRRGAHVPADHPARGPQRPRRARTGARADLPARRPADRARGPARRRALPRRGAGAPP